ncbi:MAG: sel1 repeat family protein [Campylobacteraceae bacterium]|jgi:TPR repeat protein|nr:sel1 repeat family protein [Campylobacteraceae bacterium]
MNKLRNLLLLVIFIFLNGCNDNDLDKGSEAYQKEDFATAKVFYEKSCNGGNIKGCDNLGKLYYDGKGVEQNYTTANNIFQETCNKKSGYGCRFVGVFYYGGYAVEESDEKAAEYYKKSCYYEDAVGCMNIGNLYFFGKGVSKNLQTAIDYVKKSCKLKLETACEYYKDMEEDLLVENLFKDGSHYAVVNKIKSYMKAPDSYRHVTTSYDFVRTSDNSGKIKKVIHLKTVFNGRNSYNGFSQGTVEATVDLDGNILWFDFTGSDMKWAIGG